MKRTYWTLIPFLALAMALPATAFAGEDTSPDDDARRGRNAAGATVYDFEDDNVEGEVLRPDGALISGRGHGRHASLVTLRPHFIDRLIVLAREV